MFGFMAGFPSPLPPSLLRGADVMVLPSMRECGGAVVLEAMASAFPSLQRIGAVRPTTLPRTQEFSFHLPRPTLSSPNLARPSIYGKKPAGTGQMGEAGRRRAAALYDWRAKTRALLKIYEAVVRAKSI